MLNYEVKQKLEELKDCEYINFHLKNGDIISFQPKDIVYNSEKEFVKALNDEIAYSEISYIDSFH